MDWKWKKIIHRSSLELRKLIQLIEKINILENSLRKMRNILSVEDSWNWWRASMFFIYLTNGSFPMLSDVKFSKRNNTKVHTTIWEYMESKYKRHSLKVKAKPAQLYITWIKMTEWCISYLLSRYFCNCICATLRRTDYVLCELRLQTTHRGMVSPDG